MAMALSHACGYVTVLQMRMLRPPPSSAEAAAGGGAAAPPPPGLSGVRSHRARVTTMTGGTLRGLRVLELAVQLLPAAAIEQWAESFAPVRSQSPPALLGTDGMALAAVVD